MSRKARAIQCVVDEKGCWVCVSHKPGVPGYPQIQWGDVPTTGNRLAWVLEYGPIPNGMFVCHHCDNRMCMNPEHLFLGTHQDNMRDMNEKGRHVKGEGVKNWTKLTEEEVREIKQLKQEGWLQREVAKRYGISRANVSHIWTGNSWRHVAP